MCCSDTEASENVSVYHVGMMKSRVQIPSCSALSWHYSRIWHLWPKTCQKSFNCGLLLRNARREIHGRYLKARLPTALQHGPKAVEMGRRNITTLTASWRLRWRSALKVFSVSLFRDLYEYLCLFRDFYEYFVWKLQSVWFSCIVLSLAFDF
jgi:hypothetical protein